MSKVADIDRAIAANRFILSGLKQEVNELSKKLELTENEKIKIGKIIELVRNSEFLIKEYKDDVNRNLGRTPVHSSNLEQNVVGMIMTESKNYDQFNKAASFLKVEHFYSEVHAEIYKAILSLNSRNEPFDISSVAQELRRVGTIEMVGGVLYIAEITSKVASAATVEYHARILVEMAIKRQLTKVGSELISSGYDEGADCFQLLESAESQITEIKGWIKK